MAANRYSIPLRILVLFSWTIAAAILHAEMVSYEANSYFPDEEPVSRWERLGTMDIQRWINKGLLFQHPELDGWPGPYGQQDFYSRSLADQVGHGTWYLEWKVRTDGSNQAIGGQAPCGLAAGGTSDSWYHFTIAADRVRFIRDLSLPILYFDIDSDVSHTYRIEIEGTESYRLFIDDQLMDAGVPEGLYPTSDSEVVWGARYFLFEHTTVWDYIRYGGPIPTAGSGDFDTDGFVDLRDFFFWTEYRTEPGVPHAVGWSCGDMEPATGDADIDLADFAAFQNALTGGE